MLLVTGITGHTGKYFLQELKKNKYDGQIRCIVRHTSNTIELDKSGLNIEKIFGDLTDQEFVDRSMHGVDTIMHIYNIHHSPMITELAIKNKVKRVILIHTTGIYSEFKNASEEYKKIEKKISQIIRGIENYPTVTILRPSMIYGDLCDSNMSKFIKMVDCLRVIPVINGGKSLIQPVNARDLGKAFYKVLNSPTQTINKNYNLTGATPIRMIDMFRIISDEMNKRIFFIHVPLAIGVFCAKSVRIITFGKIDYIERVQRMNEDRSYSHNEAKNDFGYTPMAFEEGIKIEIDEYQKFKEK